MTEKYFIYFVLIWDSKGTTTMKYLTLLFETIFSLFLETPVIILIVVVSKQPRHICLGQVLDIHRVRRKSLLQQAYLLSLKTKNRADKQRMQEIVPRFLICKKSSNQCSVIVHSCKDISYIYHYTFISCFICCSSICKFSWLALKLWSVVSILQLLSSWQL